MNTTASFAINAADPAWFHPEMALRLTPQLPMYSLNTDAIKTVDDVKAIFKAMNLAFCGEAATKDIKHLLGDEIPPYEYKPQRIDLPNWGESQGSKDHAGMPC